MIRHRNYYAMVAVVDELPNYSEPDDVMLLYLPLAHNFGRLMHLSGPYVGYAIAFLPDPLEVARGDARGAPDDPPERATRVREGAHGGRRRRSPRRPASARRLVDWALDVGRRASALRAAGKPLPRGLALQHTLADRLVFAKVQERLGGRLRTPISGGAPLAKEIAEFFDALGIRILEGYGLTECTTAATTNRPSATGSAPSAPRCPASSCALAEDGELLIRSETVFAGYYKEPEATAEVLGEDGWLRSGDIADDRRGRVRHDHRPQEGHHRDRRREEHRAAEPRERPQDLAVRLTGDRRRRPAAVPGGADHARPRRDRQVGGRAGHRRRRGRRCAADPRVQELVQGIVDDVNRSARATSRSSGSDPDARLRDGARRGDADAEAASAASSSSTSRTRSK